MGVVTFQDDWRKEFVSTGVFVEAKDERKKSFNLLKALEGSRVLSTTEQLKVLSTLEKSGLSLSKIEELGLLSTAEKLGALSLLEKAVNTDETVLKFGSAGLSLGAFGALFLGGQFLKALQD